MTGQQEFALPGEFIMVIDIDYGLYSESILLSSATLIMLFTLFTSAICLEP